MNWIYEIPVGRGRRFGTDMNPSLNTRPRQLGVLGQRPRCRRERYRIAGVKLDRHDRTTSCRRIQDPHAVNAGTGTTEVFSFPQDIIDNTARRSAPTRRPPTGYSAALGVPTGRYIASGERRGLHRDLPRTTAARRTST